MLDEGLVHILATDAHNLRNRKPVLSAARDLVAEASGRGRSHRHGDQSRPASIIANRPARAYRTARTPSRPPTRKRVRLAEVLSWLGLG